MDTSSKFIKDISLAELVNISSSDNVKHDCASLLPGDFKKDDNCSEQEFDLLDLSIIECLEHFVPIIELFRNMKSMSNLYNQKET